MLRGGDLSKILDEGYGDAGFNDPVPDLDEEEEGTEIKKAPAKPAAGGLKQSPDATAKNDSPSSQAAPAATGGAQPLPEPYARPPVLGAAPPPPEGANPAQSEFAQAMDMTAREKGYASAEEYNKYLQQSGAYGDLSQQSTQPEMPLAPGIKKAPAYMPPGAYPGDRTKLQDDGKAAGPPPATLKVIPQATTERTDGYESTYIKQSDARGQRPGDGHHITFRLARDGPVAEAKLGDGSLPWALDAACRGLKVGDIVEVLGRGEYAFKDEDSFVPGTERRWYFELVAINGKSEDKFRLVAEERIERANELRLAGNALFKQGRLLRAMAYYERGAAFMDVLEAEDMGMPEKFKDKQAEERNRRIWECSKPLQLNWALILMKLGRWREAERKCTEVLMDIDKLCVKALFRRGQCNIHLGNQEQARTDLRRAGELDISIAAEVEREMVRVEAMQKVVDQEDKPLAKKVLQGFQEAGDKRSEEPPPDAPASGPPPPAALPPGDRLMHLLEEQQAAAERDDVDDITYARQREALYNHFLSAGAPQDADDD